MAQLSSYSDSYNNYGGQNETSIFPRNGIQSIISQVMDKNWGNISFALSDWQQSQLENLGKSGISCLLSSWFADNSDNTEGSYCNSTWDNVYCWPKTSIGTTISRPCSEILPATERAVAHHVIGNAFRVCLENGTWLWGNWTNYTECADSYEEYIRNAAEERELVVAVQHILFIGSIISIVCLGIALSIFFYFKCLRCNRVTVHMHLMLALFLRSSLLIVITEPFIFERKTHYRTVDWVCKTVLSINFYATLASINWMFVQGIYLHGRLTTNVFDLEAPFKVYYVIGWVIPLFIIGVYAYTMEIYHPVQCWKDYSERNEIWILLGPIIFALLVNLIFLINIMRILLVKAHRANSCTDVEQFRRAIKATFVLFPLLGINNLLFLYNPGGAFNKYFVVFNTIFGSTQGILVSIFYCFFCKDVRDAIGRTYRRFLTRRNANIIQRCPSPRENGSPMLLVGISTNGSRLASPCVTKVSFIGAQNTTIDRETEEAAV